jgi:hypothetical protein
MEVTRPWPDESPEGTLVRAFAAFTARDGRALAAIGSAASLEQYREAVRGEVHPRWHEWTAEALRAHHPDMPPEAAEWQVRQMAARRDTHAADLLRQFAGATSLDELCAFDAPELLARALRAAPRGATEVPGLTVLGHVREGDAAHVLFRRGWRGPEGEILPDPGPPQVATLTAEGAAWRLELDAYARVGMPGYGGTIYMGEDALPPDEADGGAGDDALHSRPPA